MSAISRLKIVRSSKRYYARRAYYTDLLTQRQPVDQRALTELRFLEFAFKNKACRQVRKILDVACGGGRHIVALAQKGYQCTGQDYTPERVEIAKSRAARCSVTVELKRGDATKLNYQNKFDAVIALYVLFLLPSDEDVEKCLAGIYKALKPGGVLVCNIHNAFSPEARRLTSHKEVVNEQRGRGIRITSIEKLQNYDPVLSYGWIHTTSIIKEPDGHHVFHDKEYFRYFTHWDMAHYLKTACFKTISHYPDWRTKPAGKPVAPEQLIYVAHK